MFLESKVSPKRKGSVKVNSPPPIKTMKEFDLFSKTLHSCEPYVNGNLDIGDFARKDGKPRDRRNPFKVSKFSLQGFSSFSYRKMLCDSRMSDIQALSQKSTPKLYNNSLR